MDKGIGAVIPVVTDEQRDQAGLGWDSPRWRHPDALAQGVIEVERRFRSSPAPSHRGAIDDNRTITRAPVGSRSRHLEAACARKAELRYQVRPCG